ATANIDSRGNAHHAACYEVLLDRGRKRRRCLITAGGNTGIGVAIDVAVCYGDQLSGTGPVLGQDSETISAVTVLIARLEFVHRARGAARIEDSGVHEGTRRAVAARSPVHGDIGYRHRPRSYLHLRRKRPKDDA